jgi:hypothetical protein
VAEAVGITGAAAVEADTTVAAAVVVTPQVEEEVTADDVNRKYD